MSIYLDIIFILNLIVDALVLWTISVFDRRKIKKRWMLLGALLGSGIYCFSIFIGFMGGIHSLIFGVLALTISIQVAFRVKNIKTLFKLIIIGVLVSILIGGAIIALFHLTNVGYAVTLSLGSIKFSQVIVLTAMFYGILKYFGGFFYSRLKGKDNYCRMKIYMDNKEVEITALKDTGNFLVEDTEGNKIVIGEFRGVCNLFSIENQMLYFKNLEPVEIISKLKGSLKDKAQIVPFSSLGASESYLTAFRVDKAEIYEPEGILLDHVLLVVYNGRLSADASCNGIINPMIIES